MDQTGFALTHQTHNNIRIFIEPLGQWIRQKKIPGINMAAGEQKLARFTDDVHVDLSKPSQSLPVLRSILDECGSESGYKLKTKKTPGPWLVFRSPLTSLLQVLSTLGTNVHEILRKELTAVAPSVGGPG